MMDLSVVLILTQPYKSSKAMNVCCKGNVHLHKLLSNSRAVVDAFPKAERSGALQDLDSNIDPLPTERTLGMMWDSDSDSFCYQIN